MRLLDFSKTHPFFGMKLGDDLSGKLRYQPNTPMGFRRKCFHCFALDFKGCSAVLGEHTAALAALN